MKNHIKQLSQIVSADQNWGIGREDRLLFPISEDMRFFKAATMGKTVVMGHSTLLSLPRSAPLPGRFNIVLSRKEGLKIPGAAVCASLRQLGGLLSRCGGETLVMGGASVYEQLLPHCRTAYVTRVAADGHADCFYPDLGRIPGWILETASEPRRHEELSFRFCTYQNPSALPLPGSVPEPAICWNVAPLFQKKEDLPLPFPETAPAAPEYWMGLQKLVPLYTAPLAGGLGAAQLETWLSESGSHEDVYARLLQNGLAADDEAFRRLFRRVYGACEPLYTVRLPLSRWPEFLENLRRGMSLPDLMTRMGLSRNG